MQCDAMRCSVVEYGPVWCSALLCCAVLWYKAPAQVISERADHQLGVPAAAEMFFNPTGREAEIQPIGRDFGELVCN